jgi:hypothetical protein
MIRLKGPGVSRIAPFTDNWSSGRTSAESERDGDNSHHARKRSFHKLHASMIALNQLLLKTPPRDGFLAVAT